MELSESVLGPLKKQLANWEDPDCAAYAVACCLGIIPQKDGKFVGMTSVKATFWGANPIGEMLYRFLRELVACAILEYDEENQKYRWNNNFEL